MFTLQLLYLLYKNHKQVIKLGQSHDNSFYGCHDLEMEFSREKQDELLSELVVYIVQLQGTTE